LRQLLGIRVLIQERLCRAVVTLYCCAKGDTIAILSAGGIHAVTESQEHGALPRHDESVAQPDRPGSAYPGAVEEESPHTLYGRRWGARDADPGLEMARPSRRHGDPVAIADLVAHLVVAYVEERVRSDGELHGRQSAGRLGDDQRENHGQHSEDLLGELGCR